MPLLRGSITNLALKTREQNDAQNEQITSLPLHVDSHSSNSYRLHTSVDVTCGLETIDLPLPVRHVRLA